MFERSNKRAGVDTASIARRSSGGWVLKVKGKPAHSMGVFSKRSGTDYPPMPPTEAGGKLVELYSKASQDAGLGRIDILDPSLRGAGDVQFVAPYTVGIDGLGAQGRGSHTDDEDLEIASIERGAVRAALLIYRLTQSPAK